MVTAELAACLPVLVLILGVVLTAVSAVAVRVRLEDAAREAARAAARGDDGAGHRLAEQSAPGARLTVHTGAGQVEAVATTSVHPLGGWLPGFSVTERAVATLEPQGASP
jgi:hypothetical protein